MRRILIQFFSVVLAVAGGLWPSPLPALDPTRAPHQYGFDEWTVTDGLPNNTIRALIQAEDGFLWIATPEGMARFDGVRFSTFDRTNVPELKNSVVYGFGQGSDGAIWIGTSASGLATFRGGRFARLAVPEGSPSATIRSFHGDADGGMYVVSRAAIWWFRDGRGTLLDLPEDFRPDGVRGAWRNPQDGTLWILGGRVLQLIDGKLLERGLKDGLPHRSASAMAPSPQGGFWIATPAGVGRVHEGRVVELVTIADGLPTTIVNALLVDRDGALWIASPGGLCRYSGGRVESLRNRANELLDEQFCLLEDREGNVWSGGRRGLIRLKDPVATALSRRDGLVGASALCMIRARDGSHWVGMVGGGLNHLVAGKVTTYRQSDGLLEDTVSVLAEGADGAIWMAHPSEGLAVLRDGVVRPLRLPFGRSAVRTMVADRDGALWIGLAPRGLKRLTAEGTLEEVPVPGNRGPVTFLHLDRSGQLWLGDKAGFVGWRDSSGQWQTLFAGRDTTIRGAVGMIESPDGTRWFADADVPLRRMQGGVVATLPYPLAKAGRPFAIALLGEDLWMTTSRGLLRLETAKLNSRAGAELGEEAYTFFRDSDGLPPGGPIDSGFPGALVTGEGCAWFAMATGVAVVDPSRIRVNRVPPFVRIESLEVDGQAWPLDRLGAIPRGVVQVRFFFTAPSFTAPERVRFRYRLLGLDEGWQEAVAGREALFAGIGPGTYRFEVQAANDDGVWSENTAAVDLVLPPRFVETLWFWLLCSGVLAGGAWGVVQWRTAILRRREQHLRRLIDLRTRDLVAAKEAAETASRAKSEFVANIGHEIRTPINGMLGMTELALSLSACDDQRDCLRTAHASGEALLMIINDILDFSKIEAGKFTLHPEEFDLYGCVELAVDTVAHRADAKGVELVLFLTPDTPQLVIGDALRLRQVLINLIANAIKFTAQGEVVVTVSPAAGGAGQLLFTVADTGIGIPAHRRAAIFESFEQADNSMTRTYGGTGLGLAIARRLVGLMGGEIWVESEEGRGSRFSFTATLMMPELTHPVDTGGASVLAGLSLLAVDDNATSRRLFAALAAQWRMSACLAASGDEALALARNRQERGEPPFDFVVVDAGMPGRDGFATIQGLRAIPGYALRPVTVLSAVAHVPTPEQFTALREGAFLRKPVMMQRLLDRLLHVRASARSTQEPAAESARSE